MNDLDSLIRELHSNVMRDLMGDVCSELNGDEVVSCVRNVLSKYGFNINSYVLMSINGEVVDDPDFARYLRVEASHPSTGDLSHVFTFGVLKRSGKFNVIYLQSAIVKK
ncbi:MAG: hypothetical protein GXO23_03330 [Crenarchaeota archaeon]|nr:hypothetical protein [Thermoproteota archaeon]